MLFLYLILRKSSQWKPAKNYGKFTSVQYLCIIRGDNIKWLILSKFNSSPISLFGCKVMLHKNIRVLCRTYNSCRSNLPLASRSTSLTAAPLRRQLQVQYVHSFQTNSTKPPHIKGFMIWPINNDTIMWFFLWRFNSCKLHIDSRY